MHILLEISIGYQCSARVLNGIQKQQTFFYTDTTEDSSMVSSMDHTQLTFNVAMKRLGLKSVSSIDLELSMTRYTCRICKIRRTFSSFSSAAHVRTSAM